MIDPALSSPEVSEYGDAFAKYVRLMPEGDIRSFLDLQLIEMVDLLRPVPEHESLVRHPPYTWSIRQAVGHITDCERVFGYRALRMARGDATPLATFDEHAFMEHAGFDRCLLSELVTEFELVRRSHLLMFQQLEPAAWLRRGTVCGQPASVRAFAHVIGGHAQHHLEILRRRLRSS